MIPYEDIRVPVAGGELAAVRWPAREAGAPVVLALHESATEPLTAPSMTARLQTAGAVKARAGWGGDAGDRVSVGSEVALLSDRVAWTQRSNQLAGSYPRSQSRYPTPRPSVMRR